MVFCIKTWWKLFDRHNSLKTTAITRLFLEPCTRWYWVNIWVCTVVCTNNKNLSPVSSSMAAYGRRGPAHWVHRALFSSSKCLDSSSSRLARRSAGGGNYRPQRGSSKSLGFWWMFIPNIVCMVSTAIGYDMDDKRCHGTYQNLKCWSFRKASVVP
jgi:hypothetical protein